MIHPTSAASIPAQPVTFKFNPAIGSSRYGWLGPTATIECIQDWSEGARIVTAQWCGEKHWPVAVSGSVVRQLHNLPLRLVRLSYSIVTDEYLFVRLDGGPRAWIQIVKHRLARPPYQWARRTTFRALRKLGMIDWSDGRVPCWRDIRLPVRR